MTRPGKAGKYSLVPDYRTTRPGKAGKYSLVQDRLDLKIFSFKRLTRPQARQENILLYRTALHRRSSLCIPSNETARPHSSYFLQQNRRTYLGIAPTYMNVENWERGRAVSFSGKFFSNFLYSVFAV
jgi:hypothetical protein